MVTNKIASGDYSERVMIYSNDEIDPGKNLNDMSDQLQGRNKRFNG